MLVLVHAALKHDRSACPRCRCHIADVVPLSTDTARTPSHFDRCACMLHEASGPERPAGPLQLTCNYVHSR
jgi:hypothetical protein